MQAPFVAVLMGSDADWSVMQESIKVLKKFHVPFEVRLTSAHRTPTQTASYVVAAEQQGCAVFIAGAGLAAHLAGAVAAQTTKPVLGVPLASGTLCGLDALLSTVQMPAGVPVASVAIGAAGAKNAAYLAVQILALQDPLLAERLRQERLSVTNQLAEKNELIQQQVNSNE